MPPGGKDRITILRTVSVPRFLVLLIALGGGLYAFGSSPPPKRGPFDPESWPPTVRSASKVHYVCTDQALPPVSANWTANLKILTGGDQPTEVITVGGHTAVRVAGFKFNTADDQYATWANEHAIDILMQFYGD